MKNGTITYFYHAEDVHDFAWTASPEFVEFKGTAQDVKIRALIQKDHVSQGARHIEAAKSAVETFQKLVWRDYPYPNITVVDPRRVRARWTAWNIRRCSRWARITACPRASGCPSW
ncbi:MAG: hypothetical protein R3C26_09950 [Calditrichia bacterium]